MDVRIPRTRVLHIDRSTCTDDEICPAVIEIEGLVGFKGMVTKVVTDPADAERVPPQVMIADPVLAAAVRPHVGHGEVGSLVPDTLLDLIREAGR